MGESGLPTAGRIPHMPRQGLASSEFSSAHAVDIPRLQAVFLSHWGIVEPVAKVIFVRHPWTTRERLARPHLLTEEHAQMETITWRPTHEDHDPEREKWSSAL